MLLLLVKNFGINESIIKYASSIINKKDVDIENLLKTIYDDKIKIEKQKEETLKELNQVKFLKSNLKKDNEYLKNKEKELIDNAKLKAKDILLDAKNKAESIISEIKQMQKESTDINKINSIKNKLNSSIKETILINNSENIAENPIELSNINIGNKVYVTSFMQNGTILSLPNKNNEVLIQIGTIKTKINIKYLELPKKELSKENTHSFAKISKTKSVSSEINVIGLNVDEALPLVDKFIDDCILARLKTARIVHGKGTGKLRQAIHTYLKTNKRVKSFRIGTFGEGEMGVTIIEF